MKELNLNGIYRVPLELSSTGFIQITGRDIRGHLNFAIPKWNFLAREYNPDTGKCGSELLRFGNEIMEIAQ